MIYSLGVSPDIAKAFWPLSAKLQSSQIPSKDSPSRLWCHGGVVHCHGAGSLLDVVPAVALLPPAGPPGPRDDALRVCPAVLVCLVPRQIRAFVMLRLLLRLEFFREALADRKKSVDSDLTRISLSISEHSPPVTATFRVVL
jgi:hypothetical protein